MTLTLDALGDYEGINLLRKIALEVGGDYDDAAYVAACEAYGEGSDEATLLHPANFITEDQLEDADAYAEGLRQGLGLVRVRMLV